MLPTAWVCALAAGMEPRSTIRANGARISCLPFEYNNRNQVQPADASRHDLQQTLHEAAHARCTRALMIAFCPAGWAEAYPPSPKKQVTIVLPLPMCCAGRRGHYLETLA